MSQMNSLSKKVRPLKKEAPLTKLNAKIYFWSCTFENCRIFGSNLDLFVQIVLEKDRIDKGLLQIINNR